MDDFVDLGAEALPEEDDACAVSAGVAGMPDRAIRPGTRRRGRFS